MNTQFYKWPTTQEQRLHLTTADAMKIVFDMRCFNTICTAVSCFIIVCKNGKTGTLVRYGVGRAFGAQIHANDDKNRLMSANICEKTTIFSFHVFVIQLNLEHLINCVFLKLITGY